MMIHIWPTFFDLEAFLTIFGLFDMIFLVLRTFSMILGILKVFTCWASFFRVLSIIYLFLK